MFTNSNGGGYLELILGPMFSGKTTRLIDVYKKYTYIGKKVVTLNYYEDTRYDQTMLSTHDKIMIPCIQTSRISDVWNNKIINEINGEIINGEIRNADVILINEGQFFEDLYECVIDMVENHNKIVYICGLDGDFKRNRFGKILDLIPYCDKIVKLHSLCSICKNGKSAIFSHRLTDESSQVVIGATNYIPLCRTCYNKSN